MIDDIIDLMRARIAMAGQPLIMPTETCAVIVNHIEELEKVLQEKDNHIRKLERFISWQAPREKDND